MTKCKSLLSVAVATGVCASAVSNHAAELELVADGFVSPLNAVSHPGDTSILLVGDQAGTISVITGDGEKSEDLFLDLRDRMLKPNAGFDERGLLGLAFHPDYSENHKFYVYYSAALREGGPEEWNHTAHLSEFKVSADNPLVADSDSERLIMQVDQPQFNHDGGRIAFGPDGFLYVGLGDGGAGNDVGPGHGENGNGQNIETLLGSILRIDVDGAEPYGIPADNPFVGKPGRDEIYAYGLRNPWGLSFDRGGSHRLFVADVGQNRFEEVNIIENGGNYGWRVREGFSGFDPKKAMDKEIEAPTVDANGEPFDEPAFAYKSSLAFNGDPEAMGRSITGGYVYRGSEHPDWVGKYIFADWVGSSEGTLYVATEAEDGSWALAKLIDAPGFVTALGEDASGELYVMTNESRGVVGESGKVWRLTSN